MQCHANGDAVTNCCCVCRCMICTEITLCFPHSPAAHLPSPSIPIPPSPPLPYPSLAIASVCHPYDALFLSHLPKPPISYLPSSTLPSSLSATFFHSQSASVPLFSSIRFVASSLSVGA
ncbi:hypothetical protein LY76DRAFT_594478 [Colletotrichum caudatum]|nr:hypothetical protein LY76DRAFT_594478 [Colletotrichum caudatum]